MADRAHGADGTASEPVRPGALSALLQELAACPEASEAAMAPGPRPGAVVATRFELVRELGRGGFGVVWEARDRELGRRVAFKVVRAGRRRDVCEERLLREAEAAARLSHPNIVTLHDVGRSEHGPFLVLELLQGGTLAHRLARGALPVRESLRVAAEVAKGLAHAHAQGVVHRDLKPENVFLCDDGRVKVLDLGLAHAFGRRRPEGGTPAYMAPEQLEGAPEDERTDVFALGVMLFEMLTRTLPFPTEKALRSSSAAPALDVPDDPALADLVSRMLAKRPVKRPRDGSEVLAALAAFERDSPRAAHPASGALHARTRRRPAALLAAGALLVGGVAAAVLVSRLPSAQLARDAPPPSIAVLAFADLSPQQDQEYLADGVAEEILTALSRVEGLRVVGRTSSFHFKGRGEDLRTIGSLLGVAKVLEGSIRRSGDRIRVSAQLVNVADGYRVWSETYDRSVTDLFATQDEIARAVVLGVSPKLAPVRPSEVAGAPSADPEAYAQLLRGRHLAARATPEALRLAVAAFERAIQLDPGYAAAHAALASAHLNVPVIVARGYMPDAQNDEHTALARALAERAISLQPQLPDGYTVRGWIRFSLDQDWDAARADLEKAASLGADVRAPYADLIALVGNVDEAIALKRKVLADDPLSAEARRLAMLHNAVGEYARARAVLGRMLEIYPDTPRGLRELAFTELLENRPEAALETARRIQIEWMRRLVDALAYHSLGRAREADEALEWLRRSEGLAYQVAQVHAWRGERDLAFASLDLARAKRDPGLQYVTFDPLLRNVRGDPRYADFLEKMKLPVARSPE